MLHNSNLFANDINELNESYMDKTGEFIERIHYHMEDYTKKISRSDAKMMALLRNRLEIDQKAQRSIVVPFEILKLLEICIIQAALHEGLQLINTDTKLHGLKPAKDKYELERLYAGTNFTVVPV